MSYSYDKFLKPLSTNDSNIHVLDDDGVVRYTINPSSIINSMVNNNILKLNFINRIIQIPFSSLNESKAALVLLQSQIDDLRASDVLSIKTINNISLIGDGNIDVQEPIDNLVLEQLDTTYLDDKVSFTKANYENTFDYISQYVYLKRGNNQGFFNSLDESSYSSGDSPSGTLWTSYYVDNVENGFTYFNPNERTWVSWEQAVDYNPPTMVDNATACLIMYDVLDDRYYAFVMKSWTSGNAGGGYSYDRYSIYPASQEPKYISFSDGSRMVSAPKGIQLGSNNGSLLISESIDILSGEQKFDISTTTASFGISDVDGNFTYYQTIQSAISDASDGDTIEMFTNYTHAQYSGSVTISKNLNFNLNGHTIKTNYGVTYTINSGSIVRINNGDFVVQGNTPIYIEASSTIDCSGLFIYADQTSFGVVVDSSVAYNLNILFSGGGTAILASNSKIYDSRVSASASYGNNGISADSCILQNCHVDSSTGNGISLGNSKALDCSVSSYLSGFSISGNSLLNNCSSISSNTSLNINIYNSSSEIRNSSFLSESSNCLQSVLQQNSKLILTNSSFKSNGGGDGANISIDSSYIEINGCDIDSYDSIAVRVFSNVTDSVKIIGCILKSGLHGVWCQKATILNTYIYSNEGSYNINSSSEVKYTNCIFSGTSTPISPSLIQGITASVDSQGNISI